MYKMKGLLVGALVLCGVVSAHAAGIFRVDAASTAATPDGQTWATAYPTIQAGTNASAGVGEVWVKAGVYTGTTSSEVLTMKGGVSVYGGFVGTETSRDERDWAVNTTIIDGQGIRRCVIFDRQGCAQLNGVTVCNGYSSVGGGIYAYNNGSLGSNHLMSVVNCVFSNNSAGNGGAVYCRVDAVSNRSFVSASSSLTFENCLFTGNSARQGSAIMNYAYASASGSLGSGGVYANSTASCRPTFDRCVFIGNSVYSSSYAILFQGSASADAGVYMEHCTFYSSSIGFGTAKSGTPGYNMTIHSEAAPVIDYSILWGGTSISGSGTGANTPYVDHSCVQGGYAGTGNISADPLFMAAPGDLHLQVASPCIGPRTEDDLGAYEYTGPKIVGGIVINNGASSTISPQVLLSLNWLSVSGSPVTLMRFSDDGAHWTLWEPVSATRPHTLPAGDGYHTVRVQFRDAVGNVSDRLNDYVLLDANPPTGTIVINGGAASTKDPEVALSLTWADGAGSGVSRMRFSDNGSTWTAWEPLQATKTHTLPLPPGGYQTVRVQYRDNAGNYSARLSDYIRLDLP